MPFKIMRRAAVAALLVLSCPAATFADTYPSRSIRLIVPTQAGAAQDSSRGYCSSISKNRSASR